MATPKWATVAASEDLGAGWHRLLCSAEQDIEHVAGNYVIVRSTLPNPDKPGDVLRRAYSLANAPDGRNTLSLVVKVVGPVSAWLASRTAGDRLAFSGPWGKRFRRFDDDTEGPTYLFATGSGISPISALASGSSAPIWWQTTVAPAAVLSDRTGLVHGEDLTAAIPSDPAGLYFLAGDGAVLSKLTARLVAEGVPAERIRSECFFNKPGRSG